MKQYRQEMARMRNGHQADIDSIVGKYEKDMSDMRARAQAAEKRCKVLESQVEERDSRIVELDHKANPERYRLTSGAEIVELRPHVHPTYGVLDGLLIGTKAGAHELHAYCNWIDRALYNSFSHGEITAEELANAHFSAEKQTSPEQRGILQAFAEVMVGGPATPHVGTGSGGSTDTSPWNEHHKDRDTLRSKRR